MVAAEIIARAYIPLFVNVISVLSVRPASVGS